jgi:hypothetical protein
MNRELGAFLQARRSEVTPEDVGLASGPRRRVRGLRREEVAELAGGRHPDDPELIALIGQLSVRSERFRSLWAGRVVRERTHGGKRFTHPVVGELDLHYETFELPGGSGQRLSTFHAQPGSASEESLRLLASWSA